MRGLRLVQATNIRIISKGQTSDLCFLFKLTPSRTRREHDLVVAGKVSFSSTVGYV